MNLETCTVPRPRPRPAPCFAVHGRVRIDLRRHAQETAIDRGVERAVWNLAEAPAGCDVVLVVEANQLPDLQAGYVLHREAPHLGSVTIECDDAATVKRWVALIRDPDAYNAMFWSAP